MSKFKKFLALFLSITIMSTINIVANASDSNLIVLNGSDNNQSFTISDKNLTKEQSELFGQELLERFMENKQLQYSIYSYLDNVSSSKSVSYSNGDVKSSFDCDLYVDGLPGYIVEINGTSKDFWTGTKPIDADSINSSDTFTYETFGSSELSISFPASAGTSFSVGEKMAILTYPEHTNDYQYYHTFDGVTAKTGILGSITRYDHTHSTTMKFGSRTITAVSTDSTIVW